MIEFILVIPSLVIGWAIAHFYYRRSTKGMSGIAKDLKSINNKMATLIKGNASADKFESVSNDLKEVRKGIGSSSLYRAFIGRDVIKTTFEDGETMSPTSFVKPKEIKKTTFKDGEGL